MGDIVSLSELIRQARIDKGLTQDQLAAAVGVNRVSVSHWERGISRPDSAKLPSICAALGLDPEELEDAVTVAPVRYRSRPERRSVRERPDSDPLEHWMPPKAYTLLYRRCKQLQDAGVPPRVVSASRNMMAGYLFLDPASEKARRRSEDDWIKVVEAGWNYIRQALQQGGYKL